MGSFGENFGRGFAFGLGATVARGLIPFGYCVPSAMIAPMFTPCVPMTSCFVPPMHCCAPRVGFSCYC